MGAMQKKNKEREAQFWEENSNRYGTMSVINSSTLIPVSHGFVDFQMPRQFFKMKWRKILQFSVKIKCVYRGGQVEVEDATWDNLSKFKRKKNSIKGRRREQQAKCRKQSNEKFRNPIARKKG